MLKNLVKKFTSHSLNDGEEFDEQASGGNLDAVPGSVVQVTSTPKVYPTSTLALRSSVTGGSHCPQLRRNPLNSSNGNSTSATGVGCGGATTTTTTTGHGFGGVSASSTTTPGTKSQKRGRKPAVPAQQQHVRASAFRRRDVKLQQQQQQQQQQLDMAMDEDLKDSGTESDEELAIIETNSIKSVPVSLTSDYYTSQQSLSASCRSSHCGSPLLDQECASWDSFGCESGASLRNNGSATSNANEVELEVELPNHHYHTRQQFRRFLKHQQQNQECNNNNNNNNNAISGGVVLLTSSAETGGDKEALQVQQQQGEEKQKMSVGVDCETVAIDDDGTPTTDDFCISLYNKQLASPADSCGSSIDELESINGSSTAASEPSSGVKDKPVVNVEFLVPDQPNISRGRSSFSSCKLVNSAVTGGGGAKISTTTTTPAALITTGQYRCSATSTTAGGGFSLSGGAAEKRKWSQVQSGDLAVGNSVSQQHHHHHGVFSGGDVVKDSGAAAGGPAATTTTGSGSSTAFRTSCQAVAPPPFGATCPASVVHNAKNQVIGDTGDKANEAAMGDVRGSYTNWKYEGTIGTTVVRRTPVRLVIPLGGGSGGGEQVPINLPTPDQFAFPAAPPAKVSPRKKYRSTLTPAASVIPVASAAGSPAALVGAGPVGGLAVDGSSMAVVVEMNGGAVAATTTTPKQHEPATTVGTATATTTAVAGAERQRPSLNFEKMREKLKNKSSRRKYANASTMAMKSKLRGWTAGYQLRSTHSECLFQPLKFPPSPTGPTQQNSAE